MTRALLGLVLCSACGPGQVVVTAWGEDFIETRIPPSATADGSTITYERFLVVIKDVSLARETGARGPTQSRAVVVDVTRPGPTELLSWAAVPAAKWDAVSYGIGPVSEADGAGAIGAGDVQRMLTDGLSLLLEGTVARAGVTKRFAWGFSGDTHYSSCRSAALGEGLTVPTGGAVELQLTLHGDHPWYDGLLGDSQLRGQAIIEADANDDGEVTLEELAAVSLTRFPLGTYDTTGAYDVKTLLDFVVELTRTVGHFQGEGECDVTPR